MSMRTENQTDVLIIGGSTAGCFAAYVISQKSNKKVLIAEKANIKRSGSYGSRCERVKRIYYRGRVPQDYGLCKKGCPRNRKGGSSSHHVRETESCDKGNGRPMGLVILKDERANTLPGNRNIKINGENMKPILAKAAAEQENVTVLNHVNITDYKTEKGKITGAVGFSVNEDIFYDIDAEAVLCATGGAAGLYRPNNPGFSRHKMWYPPFNTGAGYAMGLLSV